MAEMETSPRPIIEVRDLRTHFPITHGLLKRVVGHVKAVDGVSFTVPDGKTVGLVGESGSGKTTLAHSIIRGIRPTSGAVLFHDRQLGVVDVAAADAKTVRQVRRNMQMVFQDPYSALNPRMTVLDIVGEPMVVNNIASGHQMQERVAELLHIVGLRPEVMRRFPHAFSGGQRQRIVIARALALNPRLIIADEPTSALDVSIQAQILNLLNDLQEQLSLSYLFISHNLAVIEHVSDMVAVMYVGRLVELAPTSSLFHFPKHPYTEALLRAIPRPDPNRVRRVPVAGEIPSPANPPSGCHFHTRCPYVQPICNAEVPPLREIQPGHFAACHFGETLTLDGVEAVRVSAGESGSSTAS
jgi:peptide/nickel transport system ATP-binding protein